MALGSDLRQRRQETGLTLEHLSARTNIPIRLLEAIERDDFAGVPGGIFVRGYLRACATHLRLDPEEVVRRFTEEHPTPAPTPDPVRASPSIVPEARHGAGRSVAAILVTGVVIAFFAAWSTPRTGSSPGGAAANELRAAAAVPVAVGTSGRAMGGDDRAGRESGSPTNAAPDGLEVTLESSRRVWVSADADGRRAVYRLLQAGERVSLVGAQRLHVRAGDAGALRYAVGSGAPAPLGRNGEVRTVTFTRNGETVDVR